MHHALEDTVALQKVIISVLKEIYFTSELPCPPSVLLFTLFEIQDQISKPKVTPTDTIIQDFLQENRQNSSMLNKQAIES